MTAPAGAAPGSPGPHPWRRALVGAFLFAAIMAGYAASRAERSTDFRDYWKTSLYLRQTGQITAELGVHNYLPFFPAFMLPWSLLPLQVAIVLFVLLSVGLLLIALAACETLLAGRLPPAPRRAILLTSLLILPYVVSCLTLGAVECLLVFLIISAWFLHERGRNWLAGIPLGLAVLIKLLPAALVVYFMLTRRWRTAAASLACIALFGLGLPLAITGWSATVEAHEHFRKNALEDGSAGSTILSEKPRKAKYTNNAVPIVLRRLLSQVDGDPDETRPDQPLHVHIADWPRPVIWRLYIALASLFGACGLLAAAAVWRREREGPLPALPADRWAFGAWCALMLLASPLVWTRYLLLACWPLALLCDRLERTAGAGRPCRICTLALLAWTAAAALLAWPAARAAGAQIAAVAVLLPTCCWLSWRAGRPSADQPPPHCDEAR